MKKILIFILVSVLVCEIALQITVRTNSVPYFSPFDNFYYRFNIVPYFTKPCCIRDSISGFRWVNNNAEAFKVCRGKTVFSSAIRPNNWGFVSPFDAIAEKPDEKTFRWLVFGDSFTDGYFLERNWPSAVVENLRAKGIDSIEIHSFALNGSGIYTWHKVFLWLNSMGYEFDGIIIACFGNDLSRKFFVMEHQGQYCRWDWVDSPEEFSLKNEEKAVLDSELAALAERVRNKENDIPFRFFIPYFAGVAYDDIKISRRISAETQRQSELYISGESDMGSSIEQMKAKYGSEQINKLREMLELCKQRNKSVLIASVPEMFGAKLYRNGKSVALNKELEMLASAYGIKFINGYSIFDSVEIDEVESYFLPYDGHWNQKASDLFAKKITGLLD